ncbi:hypothetical protein CLIB1423_15S02960 [[Candida] railenensis]|uniref:Uncharacterized protein n=1 Tax=[Candida] railenensis TaxID=45579 RepID=A0A9P0QT69_9ASCO|nr:hypothetical protein CLIB1423_15S02960 [[Candida] railenensis]
MSNFLHSSPSRQTIDPLIYSFPDSESNSNTSKSKKKNSKGKDTPTSSKTNNANQTSIQNVIPSSVPPSAQKFYSGGIPTGITGWTPLISKTIFNDQLISYSPNSKWAGIQVGSSGNLNINSNVNGMGNDDFQGLSLTPFLNHNLQTGFGGGSAGGSLNQMTPFHDKSLHLADFFMDSPIRQTPLKDLDTITPSKFKIRSSEKSSVRKLIFQDSRSSSGNNNNNSSSSKVKRSITQVDTPPRQPYKLSNLSISANAENEDGGEGDDEDEDDEDDDDENDQNEEEEDEEDDDKPTALREIKQSYLNQQTPSKSKLTSSSTSKNNNNFLTPHKPISASSPSTVIMSSASKSPSGDRGVDLIPPSPTPKKDSTGDSVHTAPLCKQIIDGDDFKPAMGVFSGSKKLPQQKPKSLNRGVSSSGPLSSTGPDGKKSQNKAQMQAGMNKFQIVFTDMHTLMNGKGKKKEKKKKDASLPPQQQPPQQQSLAAHHQSVVPPAAEISLMSINNNSMNTSHLNMSSTDHSSFEMGGTSSTPNSKYFLDKMFEKPSPGQSSKIQQLLLQQQYPYYPVPQQAQHQQQQHQQQMFGNMPPPQTSNRSNPSTQQHTQQLLSQSQQTPMMMMMSTPQHHNIISYNGYGSNNENSPNSDSQNNSGDGTQYNSFSYHALHTAYPKDQVGIEDPTIIQQSQSQQQSQISQQGSRTN